MLDTLDADYNDTFTSNYTFLPSFFLLALCVMADSINADYPPEIFIFYRCNSALRF